MVDLGQQINRRERPVVFDWVRRSLVISTLLIVTFFVSRSEALEVTRKQPRWQIANAETSTKPANQKAIQTLVKGYRSGVHEPLQIAVRSQAEWDALWKRHASIETNPPRPPAIDFGKEIVVGVFLGEKPTGGHDVEIVSAEITDGLLWVSFKEKNPQPGAMTLQAFTQPFHIVRVTTNDTAEVRFRRVS